MRTLVMAAVLCAVGMGQPAPRFTDPERRQKLMKAIPEIDRILSTGFQRQRLPAMSYGLIIDGELVHTKTLGEAQRDTAFRIASMTKSFTALAILKLRDEGKLSLEDPVSKWIPEFRNMAYPTRDTAPIRVRQLLTHGTGLPEDNPWGDRQMAEPNSVLSAWLKKGLPFSTPPDTAYEYSNYGFALAGQVIERVSKRSYREYVEKEILAPLGMRSSSLEPSAIAEAKRAKGYGFNAEGKLEEIPSLAHGSFGAMGGLVTTPDDLAKWVAFQLSAYPARDDAEQGPVRRSSVREMQMMARHSSFGVDRGQARTSGYGYGLGVTTDCRFGHMVSHGGGLPGFGSHMVWLPEYGVGMIAMTNLTYTGMSGALQQGLDALLATGGLKPRELPPSPILTSTRDRIAKLWREKWDDQEFARLAANNLFLDRPAAVRKTDVAALQRQAGTCQAPSEVNPENWLRGNFRMECEKGWIDTTFTLAPTQPPTIQYLQHAFTGRPDGKRMGLIQAVAARSIADGPKPPPAYGACKVGALIGGDGVQSSIVRLECERQPVNVVLQFRNDGGLVNARFSRADGVTCAF